MRNPGTHGGTYPGGTYPNFKNMGSGGFRVPTKFFFVLTPGLNINLTYDLEQVTNLAKIEQKQKNISLKFQLVHAGYFKWKIQEVSV